LSAMAAPHTRKEERMQEGGRGERLGHAAILGAGQDYPSVLALQGRSATLMRLQFNRREAMAKITRTNPEGISKPFSNYSHVVTAEGAQKLVFCRGQPVPFYRVPLSSCFRP